MKTLITIALTVLTFSAPAATTNSLGIPPLPKLVIHNPPLRSPKAASLRPRAKLTPLRFDTLTPMTRVLTASNGIVVDVLISQPKRVKSAPLKVGPGSLRQVKVEYQHKESSGNAQDYVFTISEGMILNHTYRLNWKPIVSTNTTVVPWPGPGNSTNDWTGLSCIQFGCVKWGVDSTAGSQLRFGVPIGPPQNMVPQGQGFFRLEDLTGAGQ